jgi:hypothetical protein
MCNPRRIHVTAARQLAESWNHEVRRVATRTGEAVGEARVVEPLDTSIGASTLAALARLLENEPGWERDGDTFRHPLDGGYLAYHAETGELEMAARISETVEGTGEAAHTVGLRLDEHLEAGGDGVYYDDSWNNQDAEYGRRMAETAAERNLDTLAENRRHDQRTQAEAEHDRKVREQAGHDAAARLAARIGARGAELASTAAGELARIGIHGRQIFNGVLARAYRDAILAYARARGAERVQHSEDDGVIEIEFELQA